MSHGSLIIESKKRPGKRIANSFSNFWKETLTTVGICSLEKTIDNLYKKCKDNRIKSCIVILGFAASLVSLATIHREKDRIVPVSVLFVNYLGKDMLTECYRNRRILHAISEEIKEM